MTKTKRTYPVLSEGTQKWVLSHFDKLSPGAEYLIGSWEALYMRTINDLKDKFEHGELGLFLDAFNGMALTPGLAGQHLMPSVSDSITLYGLDKNWKVPAASLIKKIKDLSLFQRAVIELWAHGYWHGTDKDWPIKEYIKKTMGKE